MKSLPPFGTSLAVLLATLVGGIGLFLLFLQRRMPGPGWGTLAGALVLVYLEQRFLPGLRERWRLREARGEGKRLLKAVHRSMRKEKDWTGSETREKLEAAEARLTQVLPSNDAAAIEDATKKLEELAEKTFTRKSLKREYAEQIGVALLAALFLRAFFYEAFKIPSGSMLPTLDIGDHLFVNKFVYGLRIPFTLKKIFPKVPDRGDIVVFNRPGNESGDDIIKRVIGLPGDRIEVHNRHVTVNGQPFPTRDLPQERINADGDTDQVTDEGAFLRVQPFEETVGDHHHVALEILDGQFAYQGRPKEGTWTVEPGHVFVMGDNRDNSEDSRFSPADGGFGQVPIDYIKGRADIIWLSYGGPHGVRFDRFFKLLH